MSHFLTEKNLDTMTAVCAVDGPVNIRSKGTGRYLCAVKKAEKSRAYADRHPEKVRANRAIRSAHRLASFDESTMTGECPVCGTVGVVVKGRRRKDGRPGVMCANRAKELWPSAPAEEPQDFCTTCRRTYLTAGGVCLRCADESHTDLNHALAAQRSRAADHLLAASLSDGEIPMLVDPSDDQNEMPRSESAVFGWKTIGSGDPNKWWAENAHLIGA